jgi:hypothetical protein
MTVILVGIEKDLDEGDARERWTLDLGNSSRFRVPKYYLLETRTGTNGRLTYPFLLSAVRLAFRRQEKDTAKKKSIQNPNKGEVKANS